MTNFPQSHSSTVCSVTCEWKVKIIFVCRIQSEAVFSLKIAHDKVHIMCEDLWFAEKDDVRVVDVSEVLQVKDISSKTLYIPRHGLK